MSLRYASRCAALLFAVALGVNDPIIGGPICILGEPGARCIEGTGALSALKVMGLCQIKMYPMKLEMGKCEQKGFTCQQKMPNNTVPP